MISIIIALYNKGKYIEGCLLSILDQSYTDYEVIVVDDGSTDNSLEVVRELKKKDPRIKIYTNAHGGVSAARNTGLENANGEYITFVDADDTLVDNYLERLLGFKDADLVVSGLIEESNEKNRINAKTGEIRRLNFSEFMFNYQNFPIFSIVCTKIYKSNIILKNNIRFRDRQYGEDTFFVMDYVSYCENIVVIDYFGYVNQILEQTLSRKYIQNMWEVVEPIPSELNNVFDLRHGKEWQYLYIRSIKLSLLNNRNRTKIFREECNEIAANYDFKYLSLLKSKRVSDLIIVILFKMKLYSFLQLLYKRMYR